MFFKKREWTPPGWWVELGERRRVYARLVADQLGQRMSRVPASSLKVCVICFILVLIGINGWITIRAFHARHEHVSIPFGWPEPPPLRHPMKAPDLGDYLDSLYRDTLPKKSLDSFWKAEGIRAGTLGKGEEQDTLRH